MARVLVVDDHVPARSLIRAILSLDRHDVVEASGGRSAIEIMIREPFDLIILDLLMPDVDGYTVLQAIRTLHSRAKTPVIVVSAADEPVDLIRTAELGAVEHISKPFGYDQLERAVKRVLEATPADLETIRELRGQAAQTYRKVIDLVDEVRAKR